jgi:hypothetical protein
MVTCVIVKGIAAMNKWLFIWFCCLSTLSFANSFPIPGNTIVGGVTQNAQSLGMTVSIQKFESKLSKASLISYYQKLWGDNGVQSELSPWSMIGSKINSQYFNVQAQSAGYGSRGYLSISNLPDLIEKGEISPDSLVDDFPKMGGSLIINNQQHTDLLNISKTVQIRNHFSISANSQYYLTHYRQRGWALENDTKLSALKGRVLLMAKGKDKLSITINSLDGQSHIVANLSWAK